MEEQKAKDTKSQIKRIEKLCVDLGKDSRIDDLNVLNEALTKNWTYYFHVSGFINGYYFNLYIWEHKKTERKRCSVCTSSDFLAKSEIIKTVKKISDIELDQIKFP